MFVESSLLMSVMFSDLQEIHASPPPLQMCDPSKVHVFLGAPGPFHPTDPRAGAQGDQPGPPCWRRLELRWRDGRLLPAAGPAGGRQDEEATTVEGRGLRAEDAAARRRNPEVEGLCSASLQEYLNVCFPSARDPADAAERLSVHNQYLSAWTLSHALVLRARRGVQSPASPVKTPPQNTPPRASSSTPELFSPSTPSPLASAELFSPPCPSPRVQEGGVVLEATAQGVLCSQELQGRRSPPGSPEPKRPRLHKDGGTKTSAAGPGRAPTLLCGCTSPRARYQVLVAVVHPCHLKEVKVRSGPSAGTTVPLASVVVTDQSGAEKKVVLWREAAFWALTVAPGDVLLVSGLKVNEDPWRGETVLQSTFSSKLLNLGHVTTAAPPAPPLLCAGALGDLRHYLQTRRPLLASLRPRPPQDLGRLPYGALGSLQVNTLVHALLRVTHAHLSSAWREEAGSRCRSARRPQALLSVEQPNGQQGALLLWGAALDWLPRFHDNKAAVWDMRFLLVKEAWPSELPELHSTPWSSARCLDAADRRAQSFLRPRGAPGQVLELDVDTLLSQKFSGDVELRVHVFTFRFLSSPPPALDSSASTARIAAALSGDVTYTGCGRCAAELDADANGIYRPCYPCLPHTAVRRYYRPGVLTVGGRCSSQVCVQVPPVPLQKILDVPPDNLLRSSGPGSDLKPVQLAAERVQRLLRLPRATAAVVLRSSFLCDENSEAISQDFTLLDLRFPADGPA